MTTNRLKRKDGSATVEFAICLPVLVLILLGSIAACNMIFLKQALTEAAYQGALVAMKPATSSSDVTQRINDVLDARNIQQATIVLAGGGFASLSPGDVFLVSISAPTANNRVGPAIIGSLSIIQSNVTTIKQ